MRWKWPRRLAAFGFSGELVLDGLEKHLGSDHVSVQQALVRTLGTLGAKSSRAVEMLATMVRGLLAYEVTTALGRLGSVSGYPLDVTNRQSFGEFLDKGFPFFSVGNDLHHVLTQAGAYVKDVEGIAKGKWSKRKSALV